MRELFLGEFIKNRRLELGLTQEQLCEGICEPMTISRLENGKQTPSRNRINALLQRLGLPGERYYALLSKNEKEVAALCKEIRAEKIRLSRASEKDRSAIRERLGEKLAQLEDIAEPDDQITQQGILKTKAFYEMHSPEEQLEMLMQAIKMTVPRFDLEKIDQGLYSLDETNLINGIASVYIKMGKVRVSIDIYRQLLKYIEGHDKELAEYARHFCLVAHNYAVALAMEKRYEEAVELSQRGWQVCVEYGHYQFLPGFLAIIAECYYIMGESEQAKEFYYQAYYIYKAVRDENSMNHIRKEMKEHLNLEVPF